MERIVTDKTQLRIDADMAVDKNMVIAPTGDGETEGGVAKSRLEDKGKSQITTRIARESSNGGAINQTNTFEYLSIWRRMKNSYQRPLIRPRKKKRLSPAGGGGKTKYKVK